MNSFYRGLFDQTNEITVFSEPNNRFISNHWLSCITVSKEADFTREDIRNQLLELNIESRPLWKPMHLQPIFKEAPYYGEKIAENLFDIGLCLPSGSNLSDDDKRRIEEGLAPFL